MRKSKDVFLYLSDVKCKYKKSHNGMQCECDVHMHTWPTAGTHVVVKNLCKSNFK